MAEFYQRSFGQELPESALNVALTLRDATLSGRTGRKGLPDGTGSAAGPRTKPPRYDDDLTAWAPEQVALLCAGAFG